MRSATLARAFRARFALEPALVIEGDDAAVAYGQRFFVDVVRLEEGSSTEGEARWLRELRPDCVVFDMLEAPPSSVDAAARTDALTVVFNDLGVPCPVGELVICPQELASRAAAVPGQTWLSGSQYFVISEKLRAFPQSASETAAGPGCVLICLGGAITAETFDAAAPVAATLVDQGVRVRLLAGLSNRIEESKLRQLAARGVEVVPGTDDITTAFVGVDLAISASGYLKYELAAAGIPSVLVAIVDHQEELGRLFAERTGAGVYAGRLGQVPPHDIVARVHDLLDDAVARAHCARNGKTVVDGRGADRILDAIWPRLTHGDAAAASPAQTRSPSDIDIELANGDRFAFGENWRRFIECLDESRIESAQNALSEALGRADLHGLSFLDVGCGSGLSSLAARRLGATVHSFDYDPESVACTKRLRHAFFPGDEAWTIETGSALDRGYLERLGTFDIVYAWGVLHHTGQMWDAIDGAARRVNDGGQFFLAIYNDQGWLTEYWKAVKRLYSRGSLWRMAAITIHAPYLIGARLAIRAATGRFHLERGMSLWHDMIDWLGGWPFETATCKQLETFLAARGLRVVKHHRLTHRHGCNELIFERKRGGGALG